jgi:hypothetical protein
MIRIAITPAAYAVIAGTLPLATVGVAGLRLAGALCPPFHVGGVRYGGF